MQTEPCLLKCEGVVKRFGGLVAVNDLSVEFAGNSIHAVIGPNGSGKTTLFNLMTGLLATDSGRILFLGDRVDGLEPHVIARKGIGRTFQNLLLFPDMSVEENILIGLQCRSSYQLYHVLFRYRQECRATDAMRARAAELVKFVGLEDTLERRAGSLPYGARRLLEIARALGTSPRLLLLDEPAAGMNPTETEALMAVVKRIQNELGVATVIIEHNMNLVMNLAETITVLDNGHKIAEGDPRTVRGHARVVEAYLGVADSGKMPKRFAARIAG